MITVLFADLSGFTRLTEQLDPEDVYGFVGSCLEPLTECVTRWGGYVDKFIGDCVMALFGAPAAYENEPERALRAALDMRRLLDDWGTDGDVPTAVSRGERPRLAIGINTGTVVTGLFSGGGTRDYTAVGDVVNVASRLQSACQPGRILVGDKTVRETRHIFEFGEPRLLEVHGREESVRARHVLGERSERETSRGFRGKRASLVDRDEEMERLRRAWSRARSGRARTILVVGPAGIGKTRLVEELVGAEEIEAARVARGRSYPYAKRTPWGPVAELLGEVHGIPSRMDPDRAAAAVARESVLPWTSSEIAALSVALGRSPDDVSDLAGQAPADRREAVSRSVLKALSGSEDEPCLLVLEDLQWADGATLRFLNCLPRANLRGPRLLILVARPPLPDESALAELLESPLERIDVSPLSAEESAELLDRLLGEHRGPEDFVERMVTRAEGNPLFLEETVNALAEDGTLRREDGTWRLDGKPDELELPDGVESLLSTRMDTLGTSTKRVLQYASVVGRRFWSGVLADELAARPVDEDLERLREGAFIRSLADSRVPGDREYVFDQLLLQEVAYNSLLRDLRADLHGSVAEWLEEQPAEAVPEYHDLIAHHWERSDDPRRAVPHLKRAARGARERGALEDARSAVGRAIELVDEAQERARLLELAEDLAADLAEDERRGELIDALETLADREGSAALAAEAAYRRARLELAAGRLEAARELGERALEGFRETGDTSRQGDTLSLLGRVAHLWGNYREAGRRYRSSMSRQREAGDRYGEAESLDRLGLVRMDVGRFEEAVETFEEVRSLCLAIGARPLEARCTAHRATVLRSLGRLEEAEETAREALERARSSGSPRARVSAELTLAMALADRGQREEAAGFLDRVLEFAGDRERPALAARAYLVRADVVSGERAADAARAAIDAASESGLVHVEILALSRLAEVRLDAGEVEHAEELSGRAEGLLREHGNVQGPEERVYWVRARALRAAGREEASREALERAGDVVREKADMIEDPPARDSFLERAPVDASAPAGGAAAE